MQQWRWPSPPPPPSDDNKKYCQNIVHDICRKYIFRVFFFLWNFDFIISFDLFAFARSFFFILLICLFWFRLSHQTFVESFKKKKTKSVIHTQTKTSIQIFSYSVSTHKNTITEIVGINLLEQTIFSNENSLLCFAQLCQNTKRTIKIKHLPKFRSFSALFNFFLIRQLFSIYHKKKLCTCATFSKISRNN